MVPGIVCSVLSVDGARLHPLAGPSLPGSYSAALDDLTIGPLVGSCGAAVYWRQAVAVTDIARDPRWAKFKDLALQLGFKACWSTPIFSGDRVVATFAFYFHEQRGPSHLEQQIVDASVHLCAIAIERDERVRERQRLTYMDVLTGLPNRGQFNQGLSDKAEQNGGGWGIILIDLDNLEFVNDTFGHGTGDELIQVVAARIASVAGKERTFRIGGDEFAIIVDTAGSPTLSTLAGEVLDVVKQQARCGSHAVVPRVTMGGYVAGPGENAEAANLAPYI